MVGLRDAAGAAKFAGVNSKISASQCSRALIHRESHKPHEAQVRALGHLAVVASLNCSAFGEHWRPKRAISGWDVKRAVLLQLGLTVNTTFDQANLPDYWVLLLNYSSYSPPINGQQLNFSLSGTPV